MAATIKHSISYIVELLEDVDEYHHKGVKFFIDDFKMKHFIIKNHRILLNKHHQIDDDYDGINLYGSVECKVFEIQHIVSEL